MRLDPQEIAAIKFATAEAFGHDAVVRLFGSRTDDQVRGGDIDLHVETAPLADENRARHLFEDHLFRALPPRKVDVVVSRRGRTPSGFERIGYRDRVVL